ncbi:MAG: phytanoyl-CoA dioxygenase family protein [Planctomycetes bacterium]|nr:phytanoyl-CoA dioxygenase family protein [Planctomycetota bacterium]
MIATDAEPAAAAAPTACVPSRRNLSLAQLRSFSEDGFVVLRNVIPPHLIAGMRSAFSRAGSRMLTQLRAEGMIPGVGMDQPFESGIAAAGDAMKRFGRSWRQEIAGPELYDLHRAPLLVDAMESLLPHGVCAHPIYNARPKLPNHALTTVPWHQDSAYFGAHTAQKSIITAWLPLVPVDAANGCLQVALGSHRYGLMPHHTESGEGQFLEITGGDPRPDVVVTIEMMPGDALVFGNLLWHRSLPNRSDHVRWSVDLRFHSQGDRDVNGYQREWIVRSPTRRESSCEEWLAQEFPAR